MFQEFPDDNLSDGFLSERRQKIAEQSVINNEERRNDLKRSKSVFIGAVSGLALAGIVGWFALSPRYAAENVGEIPVIRRTQTAVKVLPSDPGGMEILNQDKTVYGIIDKSGPESPAVESILPPPEQPILPVVQAENNQQLPSPDQIGSKIEEERVVGTAQVAAIENTVGKNDTPAAVVNETPEIKLPTIKEAAEQQNRNAAKTAEAPAKPAERPQPVAAVSQPAADILANIASSAPKTTTAAKPAAAGNWQIQLMSSPNKKAVESAWKSMVKKYPALNGQPYDVETADLGAKGTYYRLLAGSFSDRSGADKLCNALKKQGGSCIVKKNNMDSALIIAKFLPIIIAIIAHEIAHGWVAYKLGDDTAKHLGRLSLNPLRHTDWFGTLLLPALLIISKAGFIFGWAKPVPVNYAKLKKTRRDILLVSSAGVIMNLYLALISALLYYLASFISAPVLQIILNVFFLNMIAFNIMLALFNLIPIPPLDGSKIFFGWIDRPWAVKYVSSEKQGLAGIILIGFVLPAVLQYFGFDFNILGWYLIKTTSVLVSILV